MLHITACMQTVYIRRKTVAEETFGEHCKFEAIRQGFDHQKLRIEINRKGFH